MNKQRPRSDTLECVLALCLCMFVHTVRLWNVLFRHRNVVRLYTVLYWSIYVYRDGWSVQRSRLALSFHQCTNIHVLDIFERGGRCITYRYIFTYRYMHIYRHLYYQYLEAFSHIGKFTSWIYTFERHTLKCRVVPCMWAVYLYLLLYILELSKKSVPVCWRIGAVRVFLGLRRKKIDFTWKLSGKYDPPCKYIYVYHACFM